MIFALLLACLVSSTRAISHGDLQPAETLIVDTRVPVYDSGHWVMLSQEEHVDLLHRRVATAKSAQATTTTVAQISLSSTTAEATVLETALTSAASALPSPFDTLSTSNFSSATCLSFIQDLLANDTFQSCYPLSMLLQVREKILDSRPRPPTNTPHLVGLHVVLRSRKVARQHHEGAGRNMRSQRDGVR